MFYLEQFEDFLDRVLYQNKIEYLSWRGRRNCGTSLFPSKTEPLRALLDIVSMLFAVSCDGVELIKNLAPVISAVAIEDPFV